MYKGVSRFLNRHQSIAKQMSRGGRKSRSGIHRGKRKLRFNRINNSTRPFLRSLDRELQECLRIIRAARESGIAEHCTYAKERIQKKVEKTERMMARLGIDNSQRSALFSDSITVRQAITNSNNPNMRSSESPSRKSKHRIAINPSVPISPVILLEQCKYCGQSMSHTRMTKHIIHEHHHVRSSGAQDRLLTNLPSRSSKTPEKSKSSEKTRTDLEPFLLKSKRGYSQIGPCDVCGRNNTWISTHRGISRPEVSLCASCRGEIFEYSFGPVDVLDIAKSGGRPESNRRKF